MAPCPGQLLRCPLEATIAVAPLGKPCKKRAVSGARQARVRTRSSCRHPPVRNERMTAGMTARRRPDDGRTTALASTGSVKEVSTADRPGARAGAAEEDLRPQGLLARGRVARQPAAAHRTPGRRGELVEAVVAGRVHRPRVAAGLAAGEGPPVQAGDPVTAARGS